ncbi:hypothetical protein H0E87_007724 [Populus deltoides]|uniref:Methyltransferase type 11 domain-containing protein n=1 Tax=Populus deltoides TaxID=3696 RepID=A0A8T2YXN3_POPDE|nr:hypothetical protein H0E87_007724 [Populus deltoides]
MVNGVEDYPKKHVHQQQLHTKYKLKMFVLVILTNLLTMYIFTSPSFNWKPFPLGSKNHISLPLGDSTTLLDELSATKEQLAISHSLIAEFHKKLNSTNLFVEALLTELRSRHEGLTEKEKGSDPMKLLNAAMSDEVMLVVGPHKLPLGYSPRMGSDEVYPPVGGACLRYQKELAQYMTYEVGRECPVDDVFAQRLMLKGCEPLPRRRCHPKSPANYVEPTPFPKKRHLATSTAKTASTWRAGRRVDGFSTMGGLDYGIDEVLKTRPQGTIRIGFDIGGGSGTFAARMKERNVTIITSSMNLDGPFNSFIASRGLISIHVSVSQRLPFFENTLDIVHSMHVLSNWIPDAMLEFTLYDIYRVLRPGGLFWLDRFFCLGSQLNQTYVPMLDRVGFRNLRWNAGMKLDRGIDKNEWYFSALLEKPMT